MDNNKVFLDSKYVSGLIKKYKNKGKILKNITLVLILFMFTILVYSFFNMIKIDRYQRYIDQKIDTNVDTILKETAKIDHSLNEILMGKNDINNYINIMLATKKSEDVFKDNKNIMMTAMNNVSPDKMTQVSQKLYNEIEAIYNYISSNNSLQQHQIENLKTYKIFYNKLIYIQSSIVLKDTPENSENNILYLGIEFNNVSDIENSYQNKHLDGIKFTSSKVEWVDTMVQMETAVVQDKIMK
ncbi:MAG: hypothetical protein ACRCZK_05140 [Oscillospiraceae bacterium]